MYYWGKETNLTLIECDKCGKVLKFDDKYFSNHDDNSCVPNTLIKCSCGNETKDIIYRKQSKSIPQQLSSNISVTESNNTGRIVLVILLNILFLYLMILAEFNIITIILFIVGNIFLLAKPSKPQTTVTTKDGQVCCAKCGSTQISADKRGWNAGTGLYGSSRIMITCLKCGHKWKAGQR